MDYLDPQKRFRHNIILMVGYVLIAIAILGAALVLLNLTYGLSRGKNGQIVQSGFVYLSSQPHPAKVYLDGKLYKSQTNTRMLLLQGRYTLQLQRPGYRNWQRSITVEGQDVQHFDYPFLFPTTLTTTAGPSYAAAPGLATQSPDQRWLLIEQSNSVTNFDLYDLKNPSKAPTVLALPASLLSKGTTQSWQAIEWSNDNQHVLLSHLHDGVSEFIVLDRNDPAQSVNLNKTFSANPTSISLRDKKYDQYYLYDDGQHQLQRASLKSPAPAAYLDHVLAYKSYANDTVLYASDQNVAAGKVAVRMQVGDRMYQLRSLAASQTYLLDLTQYSGKLYVVMGSSAENKVYIYKEPVSQLNAKPGLQPVALRALRLNGPTYTSFSDNTQFIVAEAGSRLAVYDIENHKSYNYSLTAPIDAPQPHISWMDGDRLVYSSQGELTVLDYDSTNQQTLIPALPSYLPFFAPDFKHVFTLAPAAEQQVNLSETSLLTLADQ